MKKDLLLSLSFDSLLNSKSYKYKQSEFRHFFKLRFILILGLFLFYTSSKAQLRTHPFSSSSTLVLPAGIDQVTVEGWGAGGAGGGAVANLVVGRSGGGGGGGGYAKGTIITETPQTLGVIVGAATVGNSGNGASGGASYITGYNASFYAPGGLGGTANTGGTPSPGTGGSSSIAGNLATAVGANGTAGSNALLGLLFWSGAGGNAGNQGPGAGGAGGGAISSLVLANSAGVSGSEYGGGGGGGLSSLTATQNGGNGARGHMILSYTCKTYSLTGISAVNVCVPSGTSSLVTLTGSAASLPKGTYTVTYSTNSPAQNLTTSMTVGTAGTGQFTATGLNVVGNSTITVVSLASQDCSSTLTGNNQATIVVGTTPTITLGATASRCASATAQSTTLPYTAVTNAPNTYSITWNASPSNSFVGVSNAALPASPINISIPANTTPGTYTGTLTVRNAAGCLSGNNNFTVTVNPLPAVTLGVVPAVCFSSASQSTNLSYSAAANSPTSYSITWNTSPANSFATVTDAGLSGGTINIAVPAGTAPGTYTGTLTVKNANNCVSAGTNFTVTVNPLPSVTLGVAPAVCFSSASQSTNLSYSAAANSPTSYSITWNTSPANSFATVTDAGLSGGTINIAVPAGTAPGTYTGTLTVKNANNCVSAGTNFTVTVNPLPSVTLGVAPAVCFSSASQSTNLSYSAAANSPTSYSITWNTSPANSFAAVTDAVLSGGTINIAVPAGTAPGTYTGTLTVKNGNNCVSSGGNFTVTVNPLPAVTLGVVPAVCFSSASQSTNLSYSAPANSPTSYSITWNTSPTNSFAAVTDAGLSGGIINIPVPAGTAPGTYTGTLIVKNGNNCVSSGGNFTVTVNPLPAVTLGTAPAVCFSSASQSTNLSYSAPANSPTSYSITWNTSPTNNFAAVTDAGLSGGVINIPVPAGTAPGTYTGTLTFKNGSNCVSSGSNFTVTVNPLPTITTSGTVTAVCQSASVQLTSLAYTATTNSPINYSIDWQTLADQGTTAFAFGSGTGSINNISIPANTAPGTYIGVLTILNANGCSQTQAVSLVINTSPTINTTGVFTSVCQSTSDQTTTLDYNSTTGSPVNYAIDWIALTDQGSTPFPFSSGSGSVINVNVPANTTAGTYNGVMTISTANGCPVNQAVSLTINAVSAVPTASVTQQPSCQINSGIITVTAPAAGGVYTYSIDGLDYSNASGVFTGLAPGSYNVTTKNNTSGCVSPATPLNVNAAITKIWNGSVSASWGDAANWTPAGVPVATDCVTIPDVATNPIISGTNGTFFANRITIQNEGSLIVEGTNTITVTNEVNVLGNGMFTFENNASLVQVSNAVNTGNIIYKRDTQPVRRYDLTHWSSPVTRVPALTLHDFSPGTLYDKFLKYDPVAQWKIIYHGAEEMIKGKGYSFRPPQVFDIYLTDIFHGEFVGVPNNGDILGPEAVAEKYTFFGNPYPSAIYADQFIYDNSANIYGTLYIWTHNTMPSQSVPGDNRFFYSDNDFAIYNLSGDISVGNLVGTGAPTPGNQDPPLGYIAAGQGFFAKARTTQRALFTNSMRVAGRNSQFYKSAQTDAIEKHRVWLNMTNTGGAFKQLLIAYVTGATNLWDNNYDALSMDAHPYIDFFSINQNKKLVIQGREVPFVASDTIPLGYRSALEGEFTIAIDHTDGNLDNQAVYLQDNVTKKLHNLKSGGYTFTTTTGLFPSRFVLRYTDPSATLGNEDFTGLDRYVFVSIKDKNIKLQSTSDEEKLQETAVYDVGGKLLYHKTGIDDKEWLITNLHSGPQVLLVKITLDNGKTITRKIVYN